MSRLSSAETTTPTVPSHTLTSGDQARARLDSLVTELGSDVLGSEVVRNGDILIRVSAGAWKRAAEVCQAQGYNYFCFLSGLDWMPSTSPNPRASVSDELDTGDDDAPAPSADEDEADADADSAAADAAAETESDVDEGGLGYPTGAAGGDTRFQVFARLYSTARHEGVTLKADLDPDDPRVGTWSEIYPGADWNERETWEMYGFVFDGHPNLVKLYLPGEFEGFPLRKDFPLLSREVKPWPGLVDVEPMPESAETEPVASEPPAAAPEPAPAPTPEPVAAAPERAIPPAEPAAPSPAEGSMPDTAEEAHATGTESATTSSAADEATAADEGAADEPAEAAADEGAAAAEPVDADHEAGSGATAAEPPDADHEVRADQGAGDGASPPDEAASTENPEG